MNIVFIYEDHENSELGKLLSSSYNHSNLFFSRSNTRLYKKVKTVYNDYDMIIVFFDLCPNNPDLLVKLEKLSTELRDAELSDKVHIIPIVCSEYIYLNSLVTYFNITIAKLDITNTVNYHKSCEKYYKSLLDDKNIVVGSYSKDESEYFYTSYPVFDVLDNNHSALLSSLGITFKEVCLDTVRKDTVRFYTDFYNLFSLSFIDEVLNKEIKLF